MPSSDARAQVWEIDNLVLAPGLEEQQKAARIDAKKSLPCVNASMA